MCVATKYVPKPTIKIISTNNIKIFTKKKKILNWQNHWNAVLTINKLKNTKKIKLKNGKPLPFSTEDKTAILRIKIGYPFLTHFYLISKE